jgi:copper chaperone CopZ
MDAIPAPRQKYYAVDGINCHACAFVIKEALTEGGFPDSEVDLEHKELVIPTEYDAKLAEIKQIVDSCGHYELVIA